MTEPRPATPRPPAFAAVPRGWYYACRAGALGPRPVAVDVGGARYAAFRDEPGRPTVLGARCAHMGADLTRGCVRDGRLACPLHAWEFAADGRCAHIPAAGPADPIPAFARQAAYPTRELAGHVVFYNAARADYEFPFYDGLSPADLRPAAPFDLIAEIPWHMVGANGFDGQHFRVAHDRTLIGEPVIDAPAPHARRIAATYAVTGDSLRDRLTRRLSGPEVRMTVTVWGGTLVLVTAAFRRTTSYGMVFVRPLGAGRSHLRTIVWVPRRRGRLARALFDPVDAAVRRRFIRAFMADDAVRGVGLRYNPGTLIGADAELRDYFAWLAALPGAAAAGAGASAGDDLPQEAP